MGNCYLASPDTNTSTKIKYDFQSIGTTMTSKLMISENMDYSNKTISKIDEKTIQFIHGYIMQKMFDNKPKMAIIPIALTNIIASFTFNMEYFYRHGKCIVMKSIDTMYDTL